MEAWPLTFWRDGHCVTVEFVSPLGYAYCLIYEAEDHGPFWTAQRIDVRDWTRPHQVLCSPAPLPEETALNDKGKWDLAGVAVAMEGWLEQEGLGVLETALVQGELVTALREAEQCYAGAAVPRFANVGPPFLPVQDEDEYRKQYWSPQSKR